MVEFALILFILIPIILLVVDFGRIMYTYSAVTNAAREAARYGIVHPDEDANIEQTAEDMAIGVDVCQNQALNPFVEVNSPENELPDPEYTYVKVTACFVPVTPLIADVIISMRDPASGEITVTSESKMRNEE